MNQYNPDYISPPGDTIAELMEERGIAISEVLEKTGLESEKLFVGPCIVDQRFIGDPWNLLERNGQRLSFLKDFKLMAIECRMENFE